MVADDSVGSDVGFNRLFQHFNRILASVYRERLLAHSSNSFLALTWLHWLVMHSSISLILVMNLFVAPILQSVGAGSCSCTCCAGVGCRPVLRGTISVQACSVSNCQSLCRSAYPAHCVSGSGAASYACGSASTAAGNVQPSWLGLMALLSSFVFLSLCSLSSKIRVLFPINLIIEVKGNNQQGAV